jgi:hypothetical protein
MSPRVRRFVFDAVIAATLIAAAAGTQAAYTRAASRMQSGRDGQTNYVAPATQPHIACAFAIAEECRKLDWWPE